MTIQYQGVWSLQSAAQLQSTQRWVTDPLYKNTTLLLQADDAANAAQNNTFLDSSSNSFAITRNGGNPGMTQGSFTPFSLQPGAWANYFGGTSYLSSTSTALITNAVSTFTVESWVYFTATPPANGNFISSFCTLDGQPAGPTNFLSFGPLNDGKLYLFWFDGAVKYASGNTVLALNTWYHIACVVNSNSIQFYVNGVPEVMGNTTTLTNRSGTQGNFAVASSSGGQITGYISNFRVTTTAVYTSRFTPPTGPLTPVTGTVLLTCQSNQFVDANTQVAAKTLTINGTPSVQAFSPFAPQYQWTSSVIGGSGYFDGTGDQLTMASSSAFAVGTVFTFECWVYPLSSGGAAGQPLFVNGTSGEIQVGYQSATAWGIAANTINWRLTSNTIPTLNAWNHLVVVRSGTGTNQTSLFLNGSRVANGTVTDAFTSAGTGNVGLFGSGTYTGYIASLRLVKGTAVYDPTLTTLTVPTAPSTAITNTQLLLNFTNAGIYDGTMKNNLETAGNAQISTAVVKYGSGSMYFDGTSDYLVIPKRPYFDFPGDFTIEFWLYVNSLASYSFLMDTRSSISTFWLIDLTTAGVIGWGPDATIRISSSAITTGQWYHVAISRLGASTRMFLNGTQTGSTYTSSASITAGTTSLVIAGSAVNLGTSNANVYMDDIRISTGIARYTANFIPPSVALPRQ